MLSGVLRSKRAIAVNIEIMRTFVGLRRAATSYGAIEKRLEGLERETGEKLGKHDQQLSQIFKALRQLISPPPRPKRQVGFRLPEDDIRRSRKGAVGQAPDSMTVLVKEIERSRRFVPGR